jgi:hypothetical protein
VEEGNEIEEQRKQGNKKEKMFTANGALLKVSGRFVGHKRGQKGRERVELP